MALKMDMIDEEVERNVLNDVENTGQGEEYLYLEYRFNLGRIGQKYILQISNIAMRLHYPT